MIIKKHLDKILRFRVFNKLLMLYSIVLIFTLVILSFFVCTTIITSSTKSELDSNRKIIDSVNNYLLNKNNDAANLLYQIYTSPEKENDITTYLKYDYETYIRKNLDTYSKSDSFTINDVAHFTNYNFNIDSDLQSVMFYSLSKKTYSTFGINHFCSFNRKTVFEDNDYKNKFYPYTITHSMNDSDYRKPLGTIYINYNPYNIEKSYSQFKKQLLGYILVLSPDGRVIFDSSGKHYGSYPFTKLLKSGKPLIKLDTQSYININFSNPNAYIVGIIPKSKIIHKAMAEIRAVILIALILIALAISLIYFLQLSYSKRTKNIMHAMRELQKGNLYTRIPIKSNSEDELTVISKSFNTMCTNLNSYIEKVYLLELKQKHAELVALQAQINPHFLYNTLESIRMRAIADNAIQISEMIYILATFFRNSIKRKTIITIYEELNNCKLYLELFKIRFDNLLNYSIEIPDEVRSFSILKLAIQPLIENYIVHGINLTKADNFISLNAILDNDEIQICICDNGKGIDSGKLSLIEKSLKDNIKFPNDSMGIINVSERLKLVYGNSYGIGITSEINKGTTVRITIPAIRVSEVETSLLDENL